MRHALIPLVEAFGARKRAERAIDFGDQLAIAARVAAEHPEVGTQERATYRAVLLDEYQDTGHAQRVLLRALFGAAPGAPAGRDAPAVTAVGDPCQSIYGWRGASAGNLPRFRTDFPGPDGAPADEYGLLTSFRNPPEVLALANAVSAPLARLPVRSTWARWRPGRAPEQATSGSRCCRTSRRSSTGWPTRSPRAGRRRRTSAGSHPRRPSSCAAGPTWTPIAAALRARDLPVEVVGLGGLLDTPEVRDLVSALRLVADPLVRAGGGTAAHRAALAAGRR